MEYNEDSEKIGGEQTNKQTNKQTKRIFFLSDVFEYSDQAMEYNEDSEKIGGETNQQTTKENLASFAQKVFNTAIKR